MTSTTRMLHAVIMAGGSGTRFWPKSTQQTPKQFLSLFGDETMLQGTVNRISEAIPTERIWVITNQRYVNMVRQQLPDLPDHHIVGEPVAKNTAPCVGAAAALIAREDDDATMAVLPADHLIADADAFRSVLEAGAQKASADNALVTIGIRPSRPETGYGYIEVEKESAEPVGSHQAKKVKQFREKPDITTARQFIYSGNFLWNSGMFVWQAATILEQFNAHLPEMAAQLENFRHQVDDASLPEALQTFFEACDSVSIDYGIMEKADNVFVIPGDFGWNDVGSWGSLFELGEKDENNNVQRAARFVSEDATGNLVQSHNGKMIALVGVENIAVVETESAILVCNLDKAQGVKQIVQKLQKGDDTQQYL